MSLSDLQQKTETAPKDKPLDPAAVVMSDAQATMNKESPASSPPGPTAKSIGQWAFRNRDFFNGNLGWFTVKQVTSSMIASFNMMCTAIPTAFGLDYLHSKAAEKVSRIGEAEAGFLTKMWSKTEVYKPLRAIAFVATGFTMYRGSRKIFNKLYEKLFNPTNTEAQTVAEFQHLPQSIGTAIGDVMPAEAQSTPFGAIALGGIRSLFTPAGRETPHCAGGKNATWRGALVHPKSKFAEQAIIDTLGYSAFFELSDRLYKDVQLRRHQWSGMPNSIASIKHSAMDDKAPAGDDDPSLKRLVFRRIIPTALGITTYVVLHRASKMLTGAPTAPAVSDSANTLLKKFAHSFGAEWAAIGTFFIHSAIAEKYEKAYDGLLERLKDKEKPKEVSVR